MTLPCSSFAAKQWLSRLPAPSAVILGSPPVEVRSAGDGRGLGLFAVRWVPQFSQVLANTPLVLMKPGEDLPELYQHFSRLELHAQASYLSLSYQENATRDALLKDKLLQRGFGADDLEQMAKVAGIMQNNAFSVDLNDGQGPCHRALFLNVARINHSCTPSAHVCFYPSTESGTDSRMVVHALKDIEPGDEIFISYFSILLSREERRAKAQKWGFSCSCPACDESTAGHTTAEKQRNNFIGFTSQQAQIMQNVHTTMRDINSVVKAGEALIEETKDLPHFYPALPDLYDGLAMLQAKTLLVQKRESERKNIVLLLETSALWEARIAGTGSPATLRRLRKLLQFAARLGSATQPRIVVAESGLVVDWSEV